MARVWCPGASRAPAPHASPTAGGPVSGPVSGPGARQGPVSPQDMRGGGGGQGGGVVVLFFYGILRVMYMVDVFFWVNVVVFLCLGVFLEGNAPLFGVMLFFGGLIECTPF